MALVTGDLHQDRHSMMQLMNDFPEIPPKVIDNMLLKTNGNVHLARQELDAVSGGYLFGPGVQSPSPTSPQSPIRYPTAYTPPSGSRTPSTSGSRTPSTPGTPPTMDPFRRDLTGATPTQPYTSSQQKHGTSYPNMSNSPQPNFVSQLRVTVDRSASQQSSRPVIGTDQDGQLINGTNSAASSSTGTPAGGTPSSTPTTDKPPPRFSSPSGGLDDNFSIDDEFPTQFSLTPTGPSPGEGRLSDRQISPHDARYSERYAQPVDSRHYTHQQPSSRQLTYEDQRTHNDPFHQRTHNDPQHRRVYDDRPPRPYNYDDRQHIDSRYMHPGQYPVHRWSVNGPDHLQHVSSQDIYVDPRPDYSPRYDPRSEPRHIQQYPPNNHLQQTHLTVSQSVPNLDQHFTYSPLTPRDDNHHRSQLKHAKSSQNISPETYGALIPAEVRPPEVVTSRQVIFPSPHSPPRQVQPHRPHSTTYDSRGNGGDAIMDATRSMQVLKPPDTWDTRTRQDTWVPTSSNVASAEKFLSLQLPKPQQEDDEYTQALIRHQTARFEKLVRDLDDERQKLEQYRQHVHSMESEVGHKGIRRAPFPTADQVNRFREEKRQLQIDIECMSREIELHKRQGLVSQTQHISFYDNMSSTGPSGRIPPKAAPSPVLPYPPPPHEQPISPTLEPDEGQHWSCTYCTFLNHPALDKCECCEMPRM